MLNLAVAIERFEYDGENLIRRSPACNSKYKVGSIAGSTVRTKQGYVSRRVKINGKVYNVARIIWLIVHGVLVDEIDHINRNSLDNRLKNLRPATRSDNCKNRGKRSDNTYGITGVYWQKTRQRWQSTIDSQGKRYYLYAGKDFFEACCRRRSAEIRLGFSSTHGI